MFVPILGEAARQDDLPAVRVGGTRHPEWRSYRAFVAGLERFDELRHLAPGATLRFLLLPRQRGTPTGPVTLHVRGETMALPVPVAADGSFELYRHEALLNDAAELVLNRKGGQLYWRPEVRSPGVPAGMRRLGDLRLECAVRWAIEQGDLPYLMRKVFEAAGGPCNSGEIRLMYRGPLPLRTVTLIDGQRRAQLVPGRIDPRLGEYAPPLDDTDWPDDTLLQFD